MQPHNYLLHLGKDISTVQLDLIPIFLFFLFSYLYKYIWSKQKLIFGSELYSLLNYSVYAHHKFTDLYLFRFLILY